MKLLIALAAAATTLTVAAPAQAQVNYRQWEQQRRIDQGVRSGRLTPREYYSMERQQARINRYEQVSRWDGGGLSWQERARLNRMQNHASRNIYRQKHDRQGRHYRPYYGY